ncbi:hypothetical protein L3X38_036848 [Prunus dulcis]|uniref:Integrase zinc-binding domain-containing protein n=1 Tax=Prunus dulcis TaxID=3755 RepID=A0AAD4V3H0_PRUDU|nr:hypothetical protein L3X38_036848 [Prunus dulcis]
MWKSRWRQVACLEGSHIGYFWPTMRKDSTEHGRRCDRCQRYKPVPGLPAEEYHQQNSPWPFMKWAIDLADHCIPCEVWHQTTHVNSQIPTRQWLSRSIQQDRAGLPKEKTGRRRRKMGRRAARSPMSLSHNQKEIDRRDTVFLGLWDGSNHFPTHHSPFHEH